MAGGKKKISFPGFVCIKVQGNQLERFLNLCDSQKIALRNISFSDPDLRSLESADRSDAFTAVLSAEDFFRLQPVRRKTRVHIRILRKSGLPFFLTRNRKRKAFVFGIVCALLILIFFHSRIWQIHIEGNQRYTTSEILEFLGEQGIRPGVRADSVNTPEIVGILRQHFFQITWASVQKNGTELSLRIQEGITEEEAREDTGVCDLMAEEAGTIVKMVTRSGYPKVAPGDSCEKGDLLVLGTFPILNDDQAVVRYEQVHADADIYIEREISYYREYPLTQNRPVATGDVRTSFFLHLKDFYFYPDIFWGKKAETEPDFWISCRWEVPAELAENLKVPIIIGKELSFAYKRKKITYTKEEMEEILWRELQEYEENLLEKGLQISANNVTIRVSSHSGVSSGSLHVIQKIGQETPVTQKESLAETERNPTERE